jgi:MFS family permease
VIYGIAYIGFAVATSAGLAAALWILYGAYYGINDAVGKALIADVAPTHLRGTSYGILNFAVAIAVLPASLLAGLLWDGISPSAPFVFGGACALVAVVVLALVRPGRGTRLTPASN